jgi:hypothetical protein
MTVRILSNSVGDLGSTLLQTPRKLPTIYLVPLGYLLRESDFNVDWLLLLLGHGGLLSCQRYVSNLLARIVGV